MKRKKRDLFKRIRVRLTLSYSAMLILFLIVFTLIVSVALFVVIWQEQDKQVQAEADDAVSLYQDVLRELPNIDAHHPDLDVADANGGRFFTYIIRADGDLIAGTEQLPAVRSDLLRSLQNWVPQSGETRVASIGSPYGHDALQVLMAGRPIVQDGRLTGVLYTGNDISFYWKVFNWLIRVLVVLIIVFGVVAAVVGQRMAARAMVPINRSFLQQQKFVADASHELRTPLTVLNSSIDVIDMEDGDTLSEMSKRVLADMKDEVNSMSKLVADLLTLARSDSGTVELYVETFDLTAVAEQLIRLRQPIALEKGIALSLDALSPLAMNGDSERVKQLLVILIDNALKFTPGGGRVTVTVRGNHRERVVRVQDTGIGIPAEEQGRIFERFYRVESARTRDAGGTGIGLAIAKWIVEAHRGTIHVESAPGAGSTFTVRLPASKLKVKATWGRRK
ncbi:MAG: ATP-binding protein [Tumebacillaceae bacterium]